MASAKRPLLSCLCPTPGQSPFPQADSSKKQWGTDLPKPLAHQLLGLGARQLKGGV